MDRSQHLLDLIDVHKPKIITEVGIALGLNSIRMIERAARWQKEIVFHGFDLFDGLTDEIRDKEFQVAQRTLSLDAAKDLFSKLVGKMRDSGVELTVILHAGPTSKTLFDSDAAEGLAADLVYLDGGHSYATIKSDLQAFLNGGAKVVCLDDYIHGRDPQFAMKFGANAVVQELIPNNFSFLPIIDNKIYRGDGKPFGAGQVVYPRSAWPYSRLNAATHIIRATHPKTVLAYTDDVSMKYLRRIVGENGGVVSTDPLQPADFTYVDCVRREDGEWRFMDAEEAANSWNACSSPVRVFAGAVFDPPAGATLAMPSDALPINGLDVLDGVEVGAFCWPKSAWPQAKNQIHVATRNCVADPVIQENIKANLPRIKTWIRPCKIHNERIALVSAGPSLWENGALDEIRAEAAKPGTRVACVKHAHDYLIENGIIPWACVLLDPRDHVKQFVQSPHPDTIYFCASMVSATTIDILLEKNAKIIGYNALVGAGEKEILPPGSFFLSGGTSAAMRSIALFLFLGFRKFTMFAMDSCYKGKPANADEKTVLGYNRYQKVEIGGRKFWTELELIAQAQDFQEFTKGLHEQHLLSGVEIDMRGDGIIQHIWSLVRPNYPEFADVSRDW